MPTKNNPPADPPAGGDDLGFDDFFNTESPSGWDDAAESKKAEEAKLASEKAASEKAASEKAASTAAAKLAADMAALEKAEEARRAADEKKRKDEERRKDEDAKQATLEAEARRAARQMQDQATRVFKRKSKEEIIAEEDALDAVVEARPGELATAPVAGAAEVAGAAAEAAGAAAAVAGADAEAAGAEASAAEAGTEKAAAETLATSEPGATSETSAPSEKSASSGASPRDATADADSAGPTEPTRGRSKRGAAAATMSILPPIGTASEEPTAELPADVAAGFTPQPTLMPVLPPITNEDQIETEVVQVEAGAVAAVEIPTVPQAAMLAWTPPADARDAWKSSVAALVRAAEAAQAAGGAGAEQAAILYGAAAQLARTRAVDVDLARSLALKADATGARPASPSYWRERVAVALAAGDPEVSRTCIESLAARLSGSGAAEAIVLAARVIRDQLGQEPLARAELVRAAQAAGDDPGLLVVLRELARVAQDPEQELIALRGLARVQVAEAAAQTWLDIAEVLDRKLGKPDEALAATESARQADPSSNGVFLALERRYRAQGSWGPLATLYRAEGDRLLALEAGVDAAWWIARAARVHRGQLLDEAGAGAAYAAAVEAAPGAADIRHEYHVWCAESEHWDALCASLAEEIERTPLDQRSYLQYRRGLVLESRLGKIDEALASYREAASDPAAAPAAEAVLRLLQARGAWQDLVDFLEARLARLDDPSLTVTVLYRMGETCEGPLANHAEARKHYERVIDVAPGYLPALEGLERVYSRLSAWPELAAIYEQRAILAEDPSAIALQRHRAGALYEFRLGQDDRAHEQYRLALAAVADFAPSLDAYARAMEGAGNWTELGRVLRSAANVSRDGNEAVSLAYRAARVLADRTDDVTGASACLQKCLDVSPGFLPALLLSKELAARQNDWSAYFRLERSQAEMSDDVARRHWRLYAAAEAAQRLPDADPAQLIRDVLREDGAHPGAVALAERMAWSQSDTRGLIDLFRKQAAATQDESARVRAFARLSELAADASDGESLLAGLGEVLGATNVADRPLLSLARVAEANGYPEEALRALQEAGAGEGVDAARLRQNAMGDGDGAARILVAAVERAMREGPVTEPAAGGPDGAGVSAGTASGGAGSPGKGADAATMLLRVARDPAARALAHALLARSATDARVRALHSTEEALLHDALGDADAAVAAWTRAFEAEPRPGRAFEGLRGALVRKGDAAALRSAFAKLDDDDAAGLGDALEEAGDLAGAVAAWKAALDRASAAGAVVLPWQVRLERGMEALGDWRGLLTLLRARLADETASAGQVGADLTGARIRWLLAEKLSDSDDAWDEYRRLHEARPDDTEVLEALARIAGARGEQSLAVQFLDQLSQRSASPKDAARLQRRRAEVLEAAGDRDGARAALTRALDHAPDDREALAGIRRLASEAEDWQAVVGVAAREAALATGAEQVQKFAEIAQIWEERIQDGAVAADAWRKVLELSPDDRTALAHLTALTESAGDWAAFVEYGRASLAQLDGATRSGLLRRLGDACANHLRRDEEAFRFYDQATLGSHADAAAFAALEKMLSGRNDQDRLVEVLIRRARASADVGERVEALGRAARIKLDARNDKAGAAAIYDELLAADPQNTDALRFRADFLWEAGDQAGAAVLFARMEQGEIDRDYDDFDAQIEGATFFYRFGEALRLAGDAPGAITRYERALGLNATHLPSLEAIGPLHMQAKEWTAAEKVLKQVMQLTGGLGNNEALGRTYGRLGVVEFHLGHVDRARKRLSKALELKPNDVDALKGLGLVTAAQQDWANLLNIYNNIIYHTHDPSDVTEAYLNKGLVLDTRMNLPEKAAQHYEKSLAFEASQPLAHLRLAELSLRKQDWPESAAAADRGLALPQARSDVTAGLHTVRAIACQACGDPAAATASMAAATAADAAFVAELPGSVEDYERLHEALRKRIADGLL